MAAAKEAAQKNEEKQAAEKPAAPAVNHQVIIDGVAEGLFDNVEPRKSHTRFEINGKQVVYGEKRKTGLSIVIASKLITDDQLRSLVTPQPWHGGRSTLLVGETKKDVNTARRLLKHVIANYHKSIKEAEEAKLRTAEERKEKAAKDRAEKRAAKEAAKAQAEAEAAAAAGDDEAMDDEDGVDEFDDEDEFEDEEDSDE